MRPLKIDLDDLILALSARYELDDASHYVDTQTGAVIYAGEGLQDLPADLLGNPRYRWIEPVEGEVAVAIMERFAQQPDGPSGDALAAQRLRAALSEPEPLSAFMDALPELAPQVRDGWVLFQHAAYAELAQGWCLAQGIDAQWSPA